jgi:hypothetical protein
MRRRIALTLDRLIAGLIEGPMIDQGALDALINAAADLQEKGDASDRATKAIAESPAGNEVRRLSG